MRNELGDALKNRLPRLSVALTAAILLFPGTGIRSEDCNHNGVDDAQDIARGTSRDCNANAVPDECDLAGERITFEVARNFAVSLAKGVVARDLDGDSEVDLAVACSYKIAVFFADGRGDFEEPAIYPVAQKPYALVAADFDGDGDPDLATTFFEGEDVAILGNRGDGTFLDPLLFAAGPEPYRMVARDMDGDGDPDLVTSSLYYGVTVLENKGGAKAAPSDSSSKTLIGMATTTSWSSRRAARTSRSARRGSCSTTAVERSSPAAMKSAHRRRR